MSKTVQWKRGNANVSSTYTGPEGELTVNTTDWTLNIHDGATQGGRLVGASLGNLEVSNQTIVGTLSNANVVIDPDGTGIVVLNNGVITDGNITASYFVGNGSLLTGTATYGNANVAAYLPTYTGNLSANRLALANNIILSTTVNRSFFASVNKDAQIVSTDGIYNSSIYLWANNGRMSFNTLSNAFDFNFNGQLSATDFTASKSSATGYSFYTPGEGLSGFVHVNGPPSYIKITHDGIDYTKFFANYTTETIGNLVISSSANVFGSFPTAFVQVYSNVNTYSQVVHQNLNQGTLSSSDFVATANNGTDVSYYVDLGIAGNLHTDPDFFGDTSTFNDAYLYVTGYDEAGPSTGNIGNLIIGSTNGIVKTFIGNTAEANVVTVVTSTGLLPGANVTYNLGSATRQWKDLWVSNSTIYIGGVALGVSADGNLTVNGNAVSGGGNVSLGNFIFSGNNLYNLNGGSFNNGDLSHGPTAILILPVNGSTDSIALQNTYGNVTLDVGANASITSSWLFNNNGILTLPNGAVIRDTAGNAVAIGLNAGLTNQNNYAVAIGPAAGNDTQGVAAVAIGSDAGQTSQGIQAIAIGTVAGANAQSLAAVAIGSGAGQISQGQFAVAIGASAGDYTQGPDAVAIGYQAGQTAQGNAAVAIGNFAGNSNQGLYSIAIGSNAGDINQANNSIILNATGSPLDQTTANTLTVAPIRNSVANVAEILFYNTISKEITYGNTISVAGNVTGNYFLGNGSQLTSVNAATVDILNTNGLTTVFYPTFVETRDNGQILRADVDLSYRTDTNTFTVNNISSSGNITGNTGGFAIGYRDVPQVVFTSNTTLALTDAGKHYFSSNSANVITVPNNATVSFNIGAAISIVQQGTANLTINPDSGVTLYLAGNATSSARTLGNYGMATLMKVGTDTWFINGSGLN